MTEMGFRLLFIAMFSSKFYSFLKKSMLSALSPLFLAQRNITDLSSNCSTMSTLVICFAGWFRFSSIWEPLAILNLAKTLARRSRAFRFMELTSASPGATGALNSALSIGQKGTDKLARTQVLKEGIHVNCLEKYKKAGQIPDRKDWDLAGFTLIVNC